MKKKGYFFTVDAFIAMGVLALGLVLVIGFRSEDQPILQTSFYSNDVTNLFASTEIYAINNRYIDFLRNNSNITYTRYTVLEQIGEFYYRNRSDIARKLIVNLSYGSIGDAFSFSILIDNHTIFNTSDSQPQSTDLFSSKKIISGVYNDTTLWGPYKAEVRVWR